MEKSMTEESQLTVTQHDEVSLIGFSEATVLDAYHVGQVSKELYALIEKQGLRKMILDLSSIKMLSSQTLGVFLSMRQKLDQVGGKMVLSGIDPRLYRVFKITHLKDLFEFYETSQAAIQSFK
jgi:anti-sigma B factor antagonist